MNCGILGSNYIDLYKGKSVPKESSAVINICGPLDGGPLEVHCTLFWHTCSYVSTLHLENYTMRSNSNQNVTRLVHYTKFVLHLDSKI